MLGLIKNPYPFLSETEFTAHGKHILGVAHRQEPFIY